MSQSSQNSVDSESNKQKLSNPTDRENERKKRRKKVDKDGRNFTCVCGKSYLSYPALYTHVKTKHSEQQQITQKLRIPLPSTTDPSIKPKDFPESSKEQRIQKQQTNEDHYSIEKLKEFMLRQFIKDRSKQALTDLRNSLKISQKEVGYIAKILKESDNGEVKIEENEPKHLNSNSKSQSQNFDEKCNPSDAKNDLQVSPQMMRFKKLNLIKNIIEKSQRQSKSNKQQKKGFVPCIFTIPQMSRRSSKTDTFTIDDVLGSFLNDFFKLNPGNELINLLISFFILRINRYFTANKSNYPGDTSSDYQPAESLIDESASLFSFLLESENPYMSQPVVVCKILFFFYRWMFVSEFTTKFVRFNEVQ